MIKVFMRDGTTKEFIEGCRVGTTPSITTPGKLAVYDITAYGLLGEFNLDDTLGYAVEEDKKEVLDEKS